MDNVFSPFVGLFFVWDFGPDKLVSQVGEAFVRHYGLLWEYFL